MLNRSASLAMSISVLKALPGKLDIKRHSPSILYCYSGLAGGTEEGQDFSPFSVPPKAYSDGRRYCSYPGTLADWNGLNTEITK